MKVFLINPPDISVVRKRSDSGGKTVTGRFSSYEAPLGLAYVAGSMEAANIEIELLDTVGLSLSGPEIEDAIGRSTPDLVGITTLTSTLYSAIELAKISKSLHPKVPVVFGGHGAFMIERKIIENVKEVDIVAMGEGEETSVDLANAVKDGRSLKEVDGITFRTESGEAVATSPRGMIKDLDALPLPARHLLPMEKYIVEYMPKVLGKEMFKGTPLISSRGCPFLCVFCAASKFYGHNWRPRSPENVIKEISHLQEQYGNMGLNGFSFSDDNFTQDENRVIKICELMKENGLSNLRWACESRIDAVNPELYSKMYEAGCRFVAFGIESGNEQVLRRIRKGIKKEMVRNAVKTAKKVGMKTWGYFLLGLPGDTEETMMETLDFADELDLDAPVFHAAYIYPGTEMGTEQDVDWLNFLEQDELSQPANHNVGFHPCVPTYADRDKMKDMIKYVMSRKKQKKSIFKRAISKIQNI